MSRTTSEYFFMVLLRFILHVVNPAKKYRAGKTYRLCKGFRFTQPVSVLSSDLRYQAQRALGEH